MLIFSWISSFFHLYTISWATGGYTAPKHNRTTPVLNDCQYVIFFKCIIKWILCDFVAKHFNVCSITLKHLVPKHFKLLKDFISILQATKDCEDAEESVFFWQVFHTDYCCITMMWKLLQSLLHFFQQIFIVICRYCFSELISF